MRPPLQTTFIHPKGGGLIVGPEPFVGSDCYIDKHSRVEGESAISYQCDIRGSAIQDSHVVYSTIQKSAVVRSHVAAAMVSKSALEDVVVRGAADRKAIVQDSVLGGSVVVEGSTIRNVNLIGPYLLHYNWDQTPKHRLLETDNGIVQGLLQCKADHFHLGCVCRPFSVWDKREPLLRKWFVEQCGWPVDAFDSIRSTFEQWRAQC